MIEKMKMVYIVSSVSKKKELLDGLRTLGVVHLSEKKKADRDISERFSTLSKTAMALKDYASDKNGSSEILSDDDFEKMYNGALEAMDRRTSLIQEMSAANT